MFKRWLIRSVFMLPLLLCMMLCIIVWRRSYAYEYGFERLDSTSYGFNITSGRIEMGWFSLTGVVSPTWYHYCEPIDPSGRTNSMVHVVNGHVFGFALRHDSPDVWIIHVPFWVLTILFGFSPLFVWWMTRPKTRPKVDPKRAFPVKLTGKKRA